MHIRDRLGLLAARSCVVPGSITIERFGSTGLSTILDAASAALLVARRYSQRGQDLKPVVGVESGNCAHQVTLPDDGDAAELECSFWFHYG